MKRVLIFVMVMQMLSHAYSQNPIRFFERIPKVNSIALMEKVSIRSNKIIGIATSS